MRHQPLIGHASAPPLVAVAHGSRDPRAAATVEDLLDLVRRRSGLRVATSYLDHSPPTPGQVLGTLAGEGAEEAVVLPLLLTSAYHSPLMTAALERRLAEAGVTPGPDTALVLAAAGSSDPTANATVGRMARRWRGWRHVVPAYASAASPTPAEAVRALLAAGAPRVAVASYFLAPGHFADKVRDESLSAGAVAVSAALGAAPELAEIIGQRHAEIITLGDQAAVG